MQPIHRASVGTRVVAGVAAATLAVLGSSVGVLKWEAAQQEPEAAQQPFWSYDSSASNLAVVELYRSGAPWGQSQATQQP